jgi:hypothetical protein
MSNTFTSLLGSKLVGQNLIINGNFDFWQRGTSLSAGTGADFLADRWNSLSITSTMAPSRQSFTIGQTNVPNNPTYFHRSVVVSSAGAGNIAIVRHKLEDVTYFSGKTVTLSFWAKADATKFLSVEFGQNFGTGGSPSASVFVIGVQKYTLTTSWQKFTRTVVVPSVTGKTLGTNNNNFFEIIFWFDAGSSFNSRTNSLGHQSGTFDIAQVKLEEGSFATDFVLAGGNLAGELVACQRYYEKSYNINTAPGTNTIVGMSCNMISANFANGSFMRFPFFSMVRKRARPTFNTYSQNGVLGNVNIQSINRSATLFDISEKGFVAFQNTSGVTWSSGESIDFHWTADAEI